MKYREIKQIEKYENKWVALNEQGNEVLIAKDSLKDVSKYLKNLKKVGSVFKVPSSSAVLSQ